MTGKSDVIAFLDHLDALVDKMPDGPYEQEEVVSDFGGWSIHIQHTDGRYGWTHAETSDHDVADFYAALDKQTVKALTAYVRASIIVDTVHTLDDDFSLNARRKKEALSALMALRLRSV